MAVMDDATGLAGLGPGPELATALAGIDPTRAWLSPDATRFAGVVTDREIMKAHRVLVAGDRTLAPCERSVTEWLG
jgi:hypothetical protein